MNDDSIKLTSYFGERHRTGGRRSPPGAGDRQAPGDRLLRALQFSNGLPDERLTAFRRLSQPTAAFFDCYNIWRNDHPDRASGLHGLVENVINARRGATT